MIALPRGFSVLRLLALLLGWQGLFAAGGALLLRQRCDAKHLTPWEECFAFLGLTELLRLVDAVVG